MIYDSDQWPLASIGATVITVAVNLVAVGDGWICSHHPPILPDEELMIAGAFCGAPLRRPCDNSLVTALARRPWIEMGSFAALLLLFSFAFHTLLRSPCLGVADINDFWRVMRPAGIEHVKPLVKKGHFVVCTFKTGRARLASGTSSATLVAWSAKHFGWGLRPGPELMDLRQMGRVCLLMVLCVVVASIAARASPLLLGLLLYVLVDPGYLLFFNSFYANSVFFIALFGITLWFERYGDLSPEFWGLDNLLWAGVMASLGSLVILGGASKMQYVLFPSFVTICLAVPLGINRRKSTIRAISMTSVLALLSVAMPLLFFFGPAPRFLEANNYHAVYGGIVQVASDPDGVLQDLDIPRRYWNLPRTDYWTAGVADSHPVHRHLRHLSRFQLLRLWVCDPGALRVVKAEIEAAMAPVETHPRGNYVRDATHRRKTTHKTWWQFSRIHGALYRTWPPLIWLILGVGGTLGATALLGGRRNGTKAAMLFLTLWAASQFVVIVLGEGLVNLRAHLVGTRLALDFLLVLLIWDMTRALSRRWRRKRLALDLPRSSGREQSSETPAACHVD